MNNYVKKYYKMFREHNHKIIHHNYQNNNTFLIKIICQIYKHKMDKNIYPNQNKPNFIQNNIIK